MYPDASRVMHFLLSLALVASSEAFFMRWGSDSVSQPSSQKTWVQPAPAVSMSPAYRYQYYTPYDMHKYQYQPQYQQPEIQQVQQNMAPIPISMPAGASLTPVSLQHVQLVPCMCPVAPEEAEKLQEQQMGSGPYVAQTYNVPKQVAMAADNAQTPNNQ